MAEGNGGSRRREYQARFRAKVEELEARIEELAEWARRAEADIRTGLLSEESGLRQKLAEARERLAELREASDEGWGEMKAGAQKICVEVRAAWERARTPEPGEGTASAEPEPRAPTEAPDP